MKLGLQLLLASIFTIASTALFSQNGNSEPYSFKEIIAESGENVDFVYVHKIKKGETVYRLAKLFNLKTKDIFKVNPHLQNTIISIGEEVKIPLINASISTPVKISKEFDAIPIIYKVRPKDNLFRISRVYFDQPTENLKNRNKIVGRDLSIGQELLIGWLIKNAEPQKPKPIATNEQKTVFEKIIRKSKENQKNAAELNKPTETIVQVEKEDAVIINSIVYEEGDDNFVGPSLPKEVVEIKKEEEPIEVEEVVVAEDKGVVETKRKPKIKKEKPKVESVVKKPEVKPTYKVRTTKGLAIWKKDSADTENLFALHPTAKVNSMIEITNPMLNRKVLAKVIGNLPKNSYPESVTLVVTPKVANELGVIDSRFFVEIRYLE